MIKKLGVQAYTFRNAYGGETGNEKALEIVKTFLSTDFEGGRHQRRIDKIPVK